MRLQPAIWQVLNLAMVSLRRTSLVIARCPKISKALAYKIRYLHLSLEDIPYIYLYDVCSKQVFVGYICAANNHLLALNLRFAVDSRTVNHQH